MIIPTPPEVRILLARNEPAMFERRVGSEPKPIAENGLRKKVTEKYQNFMQLSNGHNSDIFEAF